MFGLGFQELLILTIILGPIVLAIVLTRKAKRRNPNPEGLSGWLWFLGLAVVVAPSAFLWQFLAGIDWRTASWTEIAIPILLIALAPVAPWQFLVGILTRVDPKIAIQILLIALALGVVGWLIYVAILFFRKRRRFPHTWMASTATIVVLDLVALMFGGEEAGPFIRTLIVSIAWMLYLKRSKRVANTFVH